jgi:hypothetical protein
VIRQKLFRQKGPHDFIQLGPLAGEGMLSLDSANGINCQIKKGTNTMAYQPAAPARATLAGAAGWSQLTFSELNTKPLSNLG